MNSGTIENAQAEASYSPVQEHGQIPATWVSGYDIRSPVAVEISQRDTFRELPHREGRSFRFDQRGSRS